MDECPHCGEPLEDSAESCPHCGSDFETGWKSDLDYYSVELPEDDPLLPQEFPHHASEIRWETLLNILLVLSSFIVFFWIAQAAYRRWEVFLFAPLMAASLWLYYRWLYPPRRAR
jgi:hypothetical protein